MQSSDSTKKGSDRLSSALLGLNETNKLDLSPLAGKRLILTGATGLIGSNLRAALERSECQLDMPALHVRRTVFKSEADYIIHAAGYGQPARFTADPLDTIKVNTTDLMELAEYLKPGGTLLFCSTSEVYSGSNALPHVETDIGTTTPAHARACYIESKRCGEAIVHALRSQRVRAIAARLCLVYGPGVRWDDTRLLNELIRRGLTEGEVSIRDAGGASRAYLYVGDAVEMLLTIMLRGGQPVYNVGNGSWLFTVWELAQRVASLLSVPATRSDVDATQALGSAPYNVMVSMNRYVREFGGLPELTLLDRGLAKTIAWHHLIRPDAVAGAPLEALP